MRRSIPLNLPIPAQQALPRLLLLIGGLPIPRSAGGRTSSHSVAQNKKRNVPKVTDEVELGGEEDIHGVLHQLS